MEYQTIYVRTGQDYGGGMVYKLTGNEVKKWESKNFQVYDLGKSVGKPVFQQYAGDWKKYPFHPPGGNQAEHNVTNPRIEDYDSKEGRIIGSAIRVTTKSGHDEHPSEIRSLIRSYIAKTDVLKKNSMIHYKELVIASKQTGWPLKYKEDMTRHDKFMLEHRDPDLPFGWVLREDGTHVVLPEKMGANENWPDMVSKSFGLDKAAFFAWDGSVLREMEPERWNSWMKDQKRKLG